MNYIIVILFFFFQGCKPFSQNSTYPLEVEIKIYDEWLYAIKMDNLKNDHSVITRPPGIEQLLIRLILPDEGGIGLKTHCVYYQVPYKKIVGLIKIDELKNEVPCPAASSNTPWLQVLDVKDLSISMENFKLSINFKLKDKKFDWHFLMPNLSAGLIHEKYRPQTEKRLFSGLTFLKVNEDTFDTLHNKYLGKLSDRLSRSSAIRCMQVDKNCRQVGEYRCEECRYGWYQVVDYNCPQGGSRFCGQNHCGEKNEPACVRGTKVVGEEDDGICQSDLSAVMNSDHILVCQ